MTNYCRSIMGDIYRLAKGIVVDSVIEIDSCVYSRF